MASVVSLMGPAKINVNSKRCGRCNKAVYANEQVFSNGKYWHKLCYKCKVCKIKLTSQTIAHMEGEIYCEGCHSKKFGISGYGHGSGAGVLFTDKIETVMPVTGEGAPEYQERDAYSISVERAINRPDNETPNAEYSSAYTPKEKRRISVGAFSAQAKIVEYEETVLGAEEQMICMDCGSQFTVEDVYFCDHCGGSLETVLVPNATGDGGEEVPDSEGVEPGSEEPVQEECVPLVVEERETGPDEEVESAGNGVTVDASTVCEHCGEKDLKPTAKFCTECGQKRAL